MSLVGLGRAFNLRYRPNTKIIYGMRTPMMPPPTGGNFSYTENVKIQNGPSGFWGFMGGFMQGLGGLGGIFGLLNQFGVNVGGTGAAKSATGAQSVDNNHKKEVDDLKKLYGDKIKGLNVTYDDGKFYATDSKGNIGSASSFDEMAQLLDNYCKGAGSADNADNIDKKPVADDNGNKTIDNNDKDNKPVDNIYNGNDNVSGDYPKSVKITSGQRYNDFIIKQLKDQGISPTQANVRKAKAQFEANNSGHYNTWDSSKYSVKGNHHKEWNGNTYLYANDTVQVPKFKMEEE